MRNAPPDPVNRDEASSYAEEKNLERLRQKRRKCEVYVVGSRSQTSKEAESIGCQHMQKSAISCGVQAKPRGQRLVIECCWGQK